MIRPARRSGWRIGHLVGSVAASAAVLALAIHPEENALAMVGAAGLLLIASTVAAALAGPAGDRKGGRGKEARP